MYRHPNDLTRRSKLIDISDLNAEQRVQYLLALVHRRNPDLLDHEPDILWTVDTLNRKRYFWVNALHHREHRNTEGYPAEFLRDIRVRVTFSGDEDLIDVSAYNADHGENAAEEVLDFLRANGFSDLDCRHLRHRARIHIVISRRPATRLGAFASRVLSSTSLVCIGVIANGVSGAGYIAEQFAVIECPQVMGVVLAAGTFFSFVGLAIGQFD